MADERHDLGEQRHLGADGGIVLEHALPGGGADDDPAALIAHECKLGNAGDIDQPLRPCEPHGHERDQRLSAGDDTHVVSGREQRAGLVEMRGPFILERCGFHSGRVLVLEANAERAHRERYPRDDAWGR